jgi:tryptophan synthase beta chain
MAPITKMYTLGHDFIPSSIHAGGLRYHGMSPLVSELYKLGQIEARAVGQVPVFDSALKFARAEGIVPAPESSHAVKVAMDEALKCRESGESKTIVFSLSGHGYFDLTAYEKYLNKELVDQPFSEPDLERSLKKLPKVNE